MKKTKITEIIIATILIVSIAASYKYANGDKKNSNTNINAVSSESSENSESNDTNNKLVKLEKEDFIKTQIVGLIQPLTLYGCYDNNSIEDHPTENFNYEFNNFRVLEKLPVEIVKEHLLIGPRFFNEDGSLKDENTCIAKVDFKITNNNNTTEATTYTGFSCFQVDDQYEHVGSTTNRGSIFFNCNIGKSQGGDGFLKLYAKESYCDTVYFIIDKITEDNCNLVIKVAPFGYSHDTVKGQNVTIFNNNAYGLIKVNYSDIIWE